MFILALRRFSIFTINLSDKKGDTNVINNREQVNIGDNVHVPKGECKVLGVKLDSKGILYLIESADGTREWVQEYWIVAGEREYEREEFEKAILNQLAEDRINPWKNYFRRFRKQS